MRQLVILAGGKGTRLQGLLGDLPKPMIPIGGRPLLEHHVELARRHGFSEVVMFICHRAEVIQAHFGEGRRWGLNVRYQIESRPLGTAGAVLAALDSLADEFVVTYGDTMVNVDLGRLQEAHRASGADATLLLHPNDHPLDSDLVEVDAGGWITAFHNRPHPPDRWFQNLVNAGLYLVSRQALEPFCGRDCVQENEAAPPAASEQSPAPGSSRILDFGKDLFPALLQRGARLLGYNSPEYIKDVGTPERYERIRAEHAAGLVERSSLGTPQRAIFLDRDGTLVEEVSPQGLTAPEQLRLLPGVGEAVRRLNHAGWRVVVVTNQPVVAKGFCTEADLRAIHNKMETLLGLEHAFLDRLYYCPHHPEKGWPGERPDLKMDCPCRKPKTGLIQQAARDLNIDLAQSWLIGDTTTDLQTARNAGLRSVLVRTGYAGRDGKHPAQPDTTADTLSEAVGRILNEHREGCTGRQ